MKANYKWCLRTTFTFDVSVYDIATVEVLDGDDQLLRVPANERLRQSCPRQLLQRSLVTVLHKYEKLLLQIERAQLRQSNREDSNSGKKGLDCDHEKTTLKNDIPGMPTSIDYIRETLWYHCDVVMRKALLPAPVIADVYNTQECV